MKTHIRKSLKVLLIIIISFSGPVMISAQSADREFDFLETGISYKVLLKNGWDTEGKLLKNDSEAIQIINSLKTFTIKKNDIKQIVKSDEEFKDEDLYKDIAVEVKDTGLKTIELKDGSEFIGHITDSDTSGIRFKTLSGSVVSIKEGQIESIRSERSGYINGTDPNVSRLFLAPTGKNLKGGTGYFSIAEIFFPMLAFGINDYITLAGGMTILPGAEDQLYYFNGKAGGLHFKNLDLSGGVFYTNITSSDESGLTIVYGTGTIGTESLSLTLGGGIPFGGDNNPLLIIGGEAQLSNSIKFITENWIPTEPESGLILSFGLRFFGRRLAGDFGLMYLVDDQGGSATGGGWPFIPWIGFNYNFDL